MSRNKLSLVLYDYMSLVLVSFDDGLILMELGFAIDMYVRVRRIHSSFYFGFCLDSLVF